MLLKLPAFEKAFSYELNDIWYAVLYTRKIQVQFGKYCNFLRGAFSKCNPVHVWLYIINIIIIIIINSIIINGNNKTQKKMKNDCQSSA